MKRFAVKTIGCKLNQYDSQSIAEPFLENGFEWVDFDDDADVYIINTCTVTARADYSSRQAVSRAVRTASGSGETKPIVAVTGCYAEVDRQTVMQIDGVDLVIDNDHKNRLFDLVERYRHRNGSFENIRSERTTDYDRRWGRAITGMRGYSRAFIKIQDGCNSSCSYCIVPRARGREISRSPEDIIREINRLSDSGYGEVVLTGVHIGRYNYRGYRFPDLLDDILTGDGPRIRFSSIEPNEVTGRLIAAVEGRSRFCRHMHIPVQSGSDRILRLMDRRYTADHIYKITGELKSVIGGITLGADFIVGFPSETEEDFRSSEKIASECGFDYLHVFSYSDRPGTKASMMEDKIDPEIKSDRSRRLIDLSFRLIENNLLKNIGSTGEIVLESRKHRPTGLNTGISDNYIRAVFSGNRATPGEFVNVIYRSKAGEGKYQYLMADKIDER